jgi:hypothetical protein
MKMKVNTSLNKRIALFIKHICVNKSRLWDSFDIKKP